MTAAGEIRLVLADDHPIVLDGLEQLCRLESDLIVVARCRDGEETVAAVDSLRPDVLVLDVRMPSGDGLFVLGALRQRGLTTRTVLLTAELDDHQLAEAIRLGARGVVLKAMAPELLVEAVRTVHAGATWLERGLGGRTLARFLERESERHQAARRLTPRELELVAMVARGLRNRDISTALTISEGTVKIHLHNVYEKLGVRGRVELILYAQQHGLG